jgi:hypothetical protein
MCQLRSGGSINVPRAQPNVEVPTDKHIYDAFLGLTIPFLAPLRLP